MFGRKYLSDVPNRWIEFSNQFEIGMTFDKYGYFDERPVLGISITQIISIFLFFINPLFFPFILGGWGKLYIKLPIKTGHQNSDSPCWGYYLSGEGVFIIWTGGNSDGRTSTSFNMPWFLDWYRTSILLEDGSWVEETKKDRKDFWNGDWDNKRWKLEVTHKNLKLVGTATVVEREWRRWWLYNFPIFNLVQRRIEIDFEDKQTSKDLKGSYEIGKSEDYFGELEKIGFTSKQIIRSRKIDQIFSS